MFQLSTRAILLGCMTTAQLVAASGPPDFSTYQYSDAPPIDFESSYDFCVVGGGTAGLVLGNRLTESGKFNVIVFEAGPTPDSVPTSLTAGGNQFLLNGGRSLIDYNFVTVPQPGLKNRTLNYHRGRCLGGSSATNGLYYGLGSTGVYDQWEADGNPGWNASTIFSAAKQGTVFVGNPKNSNDPTYMTWNPDNYGTEGPLKIGFQGYVPASNPGFMNATAAIGIPGTMTLDENFERVSSYDSYYQASKDRKNLNVRGSATVVRIIFDEATIGTDEAHAVGVTFVEAGIFHNISCSNEVIVSAGAFHSPFLLKQSGIGPQDELDKYGIPVVVANENVGHHMQDHTSFSVIYSVKPEFADIASTTDMVNDLTVLNEEQRKFYSTADPFEKAKSKWSAPSGCTNAFQEISNDELKQIGAGAVVDAGFLHQAHNEILYESVWYPQAFNEYGQPLRNTSYISLTVSNLAALSKGSVTVGSNSALSDPVINPNYLNETADQAMAVQGVKYLRQIGEHPAWKQWVQEEVSPGPAVQSDEDILEYARTSIIPNWHASSTCRMLPKEKGGVVDNKLRVYGTKGLRVCDVSTFGRLPDVNLVGPVYAVAERGSQIIREEYGDL
ncbi:unnamed protein product [Zymoseptoria tritici ST99CH_1A5]|uniref:Glucose-methanol-choline oxidoreductase N-terminal domain-containing protein n=1 Tax=Zymoseptoria tritici ST99CH_1A5 TaxID=1276529 RepID=A0A1Y6LR85_ZYMTR|nr:unnamed protein product [Zymoseptoria tritici ST99CH_3D1]SMY26845.1 unnamed protein product [Zymoseptoria tritici ST99CH_1A5]